ncbi:helix-turn-helix domain-containing protein [Streptomyces sp. NPDC058682]|uniref:helix-turn-helix domain-containing protein n=1 Tax=Streptomyces sp. NPDC058682 TaxID=3346596 RepID=UPI00364F1610
MRQRASSRPRRGGLRCCRSTSKNGARVHGPYEDSWTDLIRKHTAAGGSIGRVHIVTQPLSDYLRFEIERMGHSSRELADKLGELRKRSGLSGARVAARCNMSQSKISRIENGKVRISSRRSRPWHAWRTPPDARRCRRTRTCWTSTAWSRARSGWPGC